MCPHCTCCLNLKGRLLCCACCGWALAISEDEADGLSLRAACGLDNDPDIAAIVSRAHAPADAPPKAYTTDGKLRALPLRGGETAAQRLDRLADQAEANGAFCDLNWFPTEHGAELDGAFVTSQRRRADGMPLTEYRIERRGAEWHCDCPATRPCAHLALFYRVLRQHQTSAAPPPAYATEAVAAIRARAQAAYRDLYDEELR